MHCIMRACMRRYAFAARFPLGPSLRKELGEQLMAAGLVGAAMGLFEELELWDALLLCYRLLGKAPAAQELAQRRLQVHTMFSVHCFPFPRQV